MEIFCTSADANQVSLQLSDIKYTSANIATVYTQPDRAPDELVILGHEKVAIENLLPEQRESYQGRYKKFFSDIEGIFFRTQKEVAPHNPSDSDPLWATVRHYCAEDDIESSIGTVA